MPRQFSVHLRYGLAPSRCHAAGVSLSRDTCTLRDGVGPSHACTQQNGVLCKRSRVYERLVTRRTYRRSFPAPDGLLPVPCSSRQVNSVCVTLTGSLLALYYAPAAEKQVQCLQVLRDRQEVLAHSKQAKVAQTVSMQGRYVAARTKYFTVCRSCRRLHERINTARYRAPRHKFWHRAGVRIQLVRRGVWHRSPSR